MKKEQKEKNKFEGKNQISMRKKEDKVLIGGVINLIPILLLIAIVISVFSIFLNTQNMNKNIDAELARALEYDRVQPGDEQTKGNNGEGEVCKYVEFDAFFLRDLNGDNYAEGVRGTCKEIGTEDTLYMELKVLSKGYLESGATITLDNDRNFYFETAIVKDNEVQDNYVGSNISQIKLKEIKNGTQKLLTGVVKSGNYNYSSGKAAAIGNDINKYSYSKKFNRPNTITFKGVHVIPAEESETGVEQRTEITKEINFDVDWYGEVNCTILSTYQSNSLDGILDQDANEVNLAFKIYLDDSKEQLNLETSKIKATIPKLNNYEAKRVVVTNKNVTSHYEGGVLTAESKGTVKSETGIIQSYPITTYEVVVTYPIEAYKEIGSDAIELKIPVEGQLTAYNNPNDGFKNPYVSNVAKTTIVAVYRNPVGDIARFDIYVGKYVSRREATSGYVVSKEKPLRMYNGLSDYEVDDTYLVRWVGNTGSGANGGSMIFRDGTGPKNSQKPDEENVPDAFITKTAQEQSMENASRIVGIYFSNPQELLGEEGEIKVYDNETGILLQTFTQSNWYNYNEIYPYRFEMPVNHVRVETSDVNKNASLSVYLVKEIDDNYILENYERPNFDNLEHIKSTLAGYLKTGEEQEDGGFVNEATHSALYEAPVTEVGISVKEPAMSTQETYKNEVFTIHARYYVNSNEVKWVNGVFLLKLPEEIIDLKINSVKINDENVDLVSYEQYVEGKNRFIKITTENEEEALYDIEVDCDITPDPRIPTKNDATVQLYAYNENGVNYSKNIEDEYDINNNFAVNDIVGNASINLQLISPQSLLTSQTARNYDEEGSTAIAPQIAEVLKDQRDATIDINLTNNYTNAISEVKILVKLPSTGNTYVINGGTLGSTFDAYLQKGSIELPEKFKNNAKIYYTTVSENLTKDIEKPENGWTQTVPDDIETVKAFLIDLGDTKLDKTDKQNITYKITIPAGIDYNKVSYSHHAVYFSLETDNGKYRTQTEPNKLGFQLTKKYNLELTKFQTSKTRKVAGATYFIYEDGQEEGKREGRTKVTDQEGKFVLEGLYIGKTYCIEEIKTPVQYELNTNIIKFTTKEEADGKLTVTRLDEEVPAPKKLDTELDGESYKVVVQVEDEVKGNLNIKKTDRASEETIANVKYRLKGPGFKDAGRILTTGEDGVINISGLSIGKEYTLEEIRAEGYYLENTGESLIKFTITNENGSFKETVSQGTVNKHSIKEDEDIPTIYLELQDNKIPTYNLTIKKIEDGKPTTLLPKAKFRLIKDGKEIGTYETSSEEGDKLGTIKIDNLYAYEESEGIDQTYLLQEIASPVGYAKMQDIEFKVKKDGETYTLECTKGTISNIDIQGNNITITLEDSPSFKLKKVDDKEETPLKNTKFVIYNVEDGTVPARDSKGELVGTREEIDGKEYYVLTTDDNGEITADLPQGLYKAVEVQASNDKYVLADETYFGIGMSKDSPVIFKTQSGLAMKGDTKSQQINSVFPVESDGGYILGGQFNGSNINIDGSTFNNVGSSNEGMVIKVTEDNDVEWVSTISGSGDDYINSVTKLKNGEYIAVGSSDSSQIEIKNDQDHTDQTITNEGSYNAIIIRYNTSGQAIWTSVIGGSEQEGLQYVSPTKDGGYVVGGYFHGTIQLKDDNYDSAGARDGMIIKYSSENEVEWSQAIGSQSDDHILSVIETSDGGLLVSGDFQGEIHLDDKNISSNSSSVDGMVIKYNKVETEEKYKCAWAKAIGGSAQDYLKAAVEIENGDYIVAGNFQSKNVNIEIDSQTTTLTNAGSSGGDAIVVRYDKDGNAKWATSFGGSSAEQVTSAIKTSDGGFVVVGNTNSTFSIGDYTIKNSNQDGFIVKYNENNEVKLLKSMTGTGNASESINSVAQINGREYVIGGAFMSTTIQIGSQTFEKGTASQVALAVRYMEEDIPNIVAKSASIFGGNKDEDILASAPTEDGGYVVVGTFATKNITLKDGMTFANKDTVASTSTTDALIVKYSADDEIEWANSVGGTNSEYINSVAQTKDGGYIVGGYFSSTTIDLDGYILNNSDTNENGLLIKYDTDGNVVWATSIGETGKADRINSVVATTDGGYIIGGYFESQKTKIVDTTLENSGGADGIIAKLDKNNQVEWVRQVKGTGNEKITSVDVTSDGGYIATGKFDSANIQVANKTLAKITTQTSNNDGMVIKISNNGTVENISAIEGDKEEDITAVTSSSDGGYVVVGFFTSSTVKAGSYELTNISTTTTSTSNTDGMLIKYNSSNQVEWATTIAGANEEKVNSVKETEDNGYIVGASYTTSNIQVGDFSLVNSTTTGVSKMSDGIVAKYDENGNVEWAISIGGSDGNDYINSVIQTTEERYVAVGSLKAKSMKFGEIELTNEDQISALRNRTSDGIIIKLAEEPGIPEQSVFEIRNKIKTFKITTAVEGNVGGEISGDLAKTKKVYEVVEYDETNNQDGEHEIKMTPSQGYEIVRITINGVAQSFEKQDHNGEDYYILPPIENIKENKHIVVTYAPSNTIFTINKKDENGDKPLAEAVFKIEKINQSESLSSVLKSITGDLQTYEEPDYDYNFESDDKKLKNVLGEMTEGTGEYKFESGTSTYPYKSNNTEDNTVANSFVKMSLSEVQDKKVAVVVKATVSSEANYDCGYAVITNTEESPEYNSDRRQFIDISGNVEEKTYVTILNINKDSEYYLHFGYRKDESKSEGTDAFTINEVKVYPVKEVHYNFTTEDESKYVSSNKGANTESKSYIEIDLTEQTGKFNLIVNAQIDSEANRDWGYATIVNVTNIDEPENIEIPAYNNAEGRFIWISGNQEKADYTTVLEGQNKYRMYIGYHKDDSTQGDSKEDKFTINSVKVVENKGDEFSKSVKSDELGKAIETLTNLDTYIITEEVVPEGYEKLNQAYVYEMKAEEKHEITIKNKKAPKLVVHHYLYNEETHETTKTELANAEHYTGTMGGEYKTNPRQDIVKDSVLYELATDGKGGAIIDGDPNGVYTQDEMEVNYYYTARKIPLTVHHYIKGTTTGVLLADGENNAVDEVDEGKQGEHYSTSPLKENYSDDEEQDRQQLNEKYECVGIREGQATGTYEYPEVIVTYEYDIKMHDIKTKVVPHKETKQVETEDGQVQEQQVDVLGGSISGFTKDQDPDKVYEQVEHGGTSGQDDKQVKIKPDPGYRVKEGSIKVNGTPLQEGKDYTVEEDGTITLKPLENVTEDKTIEVEFERIPAKVLVNHYIYDPKQDNPHTTNPVPLKTEGNAKQEQIDGYIGKEYSTNPKDESELKEGYRLYEEPANYCGTMKEPETVVNYYYIVSNVKIEATKTSQVIDEQLEEKGNEDGNVKIGSKIEYTITVTNEGNTEGQVVIKDSIPQGTTYVGDSLKVIVGEDEDKTSEYTIDDLTGKGIVINVPEATTIDDGESTPGKVTVQFKVEVTAVISELAQGKAKLENGDIIKNKATIYVDPEDPENPEEPDDPEKKIETPETENKYIEPIIEGKKEAQIIGKDSEKVSGRKYALEGESIEYTITVVNKGELEKEISIRDEVSKIDGVTVEDNEVKIKVIDGEDEQNSTSTITNLESDEGIKVTVPAAKDTGNGEIEESEYGKVTLTFKVKINVLPEKEYSKQIKNVAIIKVDENETKPETTTDVYKTNIIAEKTADPDPDEKPEVTKGEKIKYTITISNEGEKEEEVLVKDSIPEEVSYDVETAELEITGDEAVAVANHKIKELDIAKGGEGVTVTVQAHSQVKISFEVTVNDLDDGTEIRNVATIKEDPDNPESEEKSTSEVVHKYVEPIIEAEKTAETSNGKDYVTAGDTINYTITVTNKGGLAKEVVVKDIIPEGTTLIGTVKVDPKNEDEPEGGYTQENLTTGIRINVPAATTSDSGEKTPRVVKIKFTVKVDEELDASIKEIVNEAVINKDPETNPDPDHPSNPDDIVKPKVVTPIVTFTKKSEVIARKDAESELSDNEVTVGDTIKYTITVNNISTQKTAENIEVKDKIPQGTELAGETISNEGQYNAETNEITWTIAQLAKESSVELSFQVKVKYAIKDGIIKNKATVDGKDTNEDEKQYKKPEPSIEHTITKTAEANTVVEEIPVLTEDGGAIKYTITYKTAIKDYVGKATVKIVDKLPAKLNVNRMKELAEQKGIQTTTSDWLKEFLLDGQYDETSQTITWTKTIDNVDTFTNGTYEETITKEISVVYMGQDVNADLENTAKGTTTLYYPEDDPDNEGPQLEETVEDTATVKQEYKVNLKVVKEWVDDNNRRDLQPESIHISIKQEETNYIVEDYELNASNNWTFDNTKLPGYSKEKALPKYSDTGELLKYVVTEKETINHYDTQIMELTPDVQEEATNYTIKVINTFELTEEEIKNAEITKEGTPGTITSSKDEIEYTITYSAEITDYEGNATVVIEDELPYALDKEKMKVKANSKGIDTTKENWLEEYLDGGVYEEGTIGQNKVYKITWRISLGRINTYKQADETYIVEPITKTISLIYKDLDATQEKIENTASGRIEFDETQSPKEETKEEINVDIKGKLTVKYVDKETGKDLEEPQVSTGKVGDPYTTEEKQFDGYVLDSVEGGRTGEYTEEDQTVTYYYTRPDADVTVKYVDEDGNSLLPDGEEEIVIPGKIGDPYTTEEKVFDGYILEKVEGDPEGTMDEEHKEVVYVYKRIPAKVIVRYLEKGTEKKLAEEDTIQGYVGDDYVTERKPIPHYKAAEPEPDNATGKMKVVKDPNNPNEIIEDTIIVTYYYDKIKSGKVTVKHVDVDTGEEITYTEENEDGEKEEKTYGYDIEGYVGDKYETHEEDIPYYDVVKIPENASGEFSEDEETVTYYYKKKPFNFSVEKVIKNVLLNGEQKNIINNKSMKVEIVAGTISYAQLEITYAIQVSNTGEIDGKAKVEEMLPEGYKLINVADYWKETEDGNLETEVELKAGETKELEVTLKWINGSENFGPFDNTVKVTDTENEANFKDINPDDDISKAEIITSIKTGEEISIVAIVIEILLILIMVLLTCIYYKKK